jgi:hypothetical protein
MRGCKERVPTIIYYIKHLGVYIGPYANKPSKRLLDRIDMGTGTAHIVTYNLVMV